MFYTNESGRSSLPASLFDDNDHCWDCVSLEIWAPWFLVAVETTHDSESVFINALLIRKTEQLQELAQRTDQRLVRIQLANPREDKNRGWQLEEVIGITLHSPSTSRGFLVLDLADGKTFSTANKFSVVNREDLEIENMDSMRKVIVWRA